VASAALKVSNSFLSGPLSLPARDLLLQLLDGERLQVLGTPRQLGGELLGLLDGALADDEEARQELDDAALAVEHAARVPSRQATTSGVLALPELELRLGAVGVDDEDVVEVVVVLSASRSGSTFVLVDAT
jgi:hypothetical protein